MTIQDIEPYKEFDALDEQAIVSEIRGQILDKYFYEFKSGGQLVVGISWPGIRHIASKMVGEGHPISVVEMRINESEDGESYQAMACSEDLSTHEKRWGSFEQPKNFASGQKNPFAYTLAQTKAERNAIRKFIPEVAIQEGYKEYKQKFGGLKPHE